MVKKHLNHRPLIVRMNHHPDSQRLLQKLHEANISIKQIQVHEQHITFEISKSAMPVLRKWRKTYNVRLRIEYAEQDQILRFDMLTMLGLLLLITLPIIASQWIWQLKVETDSPELRVSLEQTLQQQFALTTPFLKKQLPDDMTIRQQLLETHRDLAWIHIQKNGSIISFMPQKAPEMVKIPREQQPMHLIAKKSGVITHFDIESGVRTVTPNTPVYKGDVLVSGIIENEQATTVVGAKGAVFADYWIECIFSLPRKVEYTQQQSRQWKIFVKWWHPSEFYKSYVDQKILPSFISPFVKIVADQKTQKVTKQMTEQQAEKLVLAILHQKILRELPLGTVVKKENLLHVEIVGDTVKGKVLFLINENIAQPQPISQGEFE